MKDVIGKCSCHDSSPAFLIITTRGGGRECVHPNATDAEANVYGRNPVGSAEVQAGQD